MSELIFTRYLYVKQEVKLALLLSLINKSDDALFWAFELYYSGFKNDLYNFIFKIYYDFYYTLNPSYESYLLKKYKQIVLEKNEKNEKNEKRTIASFIQDLLFRPFNTDVFYIRNICDQFELEINYYTKEKIVSKEELVINLEEWIKRKDYRSLGQWLFSENKNIIQSQEIFGIVLEILDKKGVLQKNKLTKTKLEKDFKNAMSVFKISENVLLFSKIMGLLSRMSELKKGKSIYINVEDEDLVHYETIKDIKHYKILEKAYMCGINDLKLLSLFSLKRNKFNLHEEYRNNWLYFASFSPIWLERIKKYGGQINNKNKKIIFEDDDLMEEFYSLYGLEPDEQKIEVQYKSIKPIENIYNWKWFDKKYKKNGLFDIYEEELEEFDNGGLLY